MCLSWVVGRPCGVREFTKDLWSHRTLVAIFMWMREMLDVGSVLWLSRGRRAGRWGRGQGVRSWRSPHSSGIIHLPSDGCPLGKVMGDSYTWSQTLNFINQSSLGKGESMFHWRRQSRKALFSTTEGQKLPLLRYVGLWGPELVTDRYQPVSVPWAVLGWVRIVRSLSTAISKCPVLLQKDDA